MKQKIGTIILLGLLVVIAAFASPPEGELEQVTHVDIVFTLWHTEELTRTIKPRTFVGTYTALSKDIEDLVQRVASEFVRKDAKYAFSVYYLNKDDQVIAQSTTSEFVTEVAGAVPASVFPLSVYVPEVLQPSVERVYFDLRPALQRALRSPATSEPPKDVHLSVFTNMPGIEVVILVCASFGESWNEVTRATATTENVAHFVIPHDVGVQMQLFRVQLE